MDSEKLPKVAKKFICDICDYYTSKKSSYDKHLSTDKHKMIVNDSKLVAKVAQPYICNCGKTYKYDSGYYRHKKVCQQNTDKDQLIMMLIKQNSELMKDTCDFKNIMMEVLKNGTHNTTHTNSHNKAFNLQFFLNETCKDAMNIMDFVESIKLQVTDLEKVGEVGYVEGISNIIVSNLNKLDITQRPIHCTDKKRETMYIKDAGKWEKDENTNLIRRAIRKVTHNNQRLLPQFKEKYPDYHNSYSSHSDKVTKVVIETMVNNIPEKEEKIIKNIAKSVVLDKTYSL